MSRYILPAVVAGILCVVSVWGAWRAVGQTEPLFPSKPREDPEAAAVSGNVSHTVFETAQSLAIDHGSTVNFWIRNHGADPVEITIDGAGARAIAPGGEGHISADVDFFRRAYVFSAHSMIEGSPLDIDYKIAQRA